MKWLNWMTKPVGEASISEVEIFANEHFEAFLLECRGNRKTNWVVDIHSHEGHIVWRQRMAGLDSRRWLEVLCSMLQLVNTTLNETPRTEFESNSTLGID